MSSEYVLKANRSLPCLPVLPQPSLLTRMVLRKQVGHITLLWIPSQRLLINIQMKSTILLTKVLSALDVIPAHSQAVSSLHTCTPWAPCVHAASLSSKLCTCCFLILEYLCSPSLPQNFFPTASSAFKSSLKPFPHVLHGVPLCCTTPQEIPHTE